VTCGCNLISQDSPPPGKYREAIRYYEPFIQKVSSCSPLLASRLCFHAGALQATEAHGASLLSVSAMTLANLCVAYIMISDNEKAEEVRSCACRLTATCDL
jgi:hypothetical protein